MAQYKLINNVADPPSQTESDNLFQLLLEYEYSYNPLPFKDADVIDQFNDNKTVHIFQTGVSPNFYTQVTAPTPEAVKSHATETAAKNQVKTDLVGGTG